jgi:hypothetical protein
MDYYLMFHIYHKDFFVKRKIPLVEYHGLVHILTIDMELFLNQGNLDDIQFIVDSFQYYKIDTTDRILFLLERMNILNENIVVYLLSQIEVRVRNNNMFIIHSWNWYVQKKSNIDQFLCNLAHNNIDMPQYIDIIVGKDVDNRVDWKTFGQYFLFYGCHKCFELIRAKFPHLIFDYSSIIEFGISLEKTGCIKYIAKNRLFDLTQNHILHAVYKENFPSFKTFMSIIKKGYIMQSNDDRIKLFISLVQYQRGSKIWDFIDLMIADVLTDEDINQILNSDHYKIDNTIRNLLKKSN